jgi:hypothetical protein
MNDSEEGEELVVIRSYAFEFEALVAQATLEGAGFDVLILSDGTSGVHPHLNFARGIRLAVPAADAEAALELLDAPVEPDPADESSDIMEEEE